MLTAIIDASFGDCGKAKICDFLLKDYDIIARFCGSSNSGHSIVHDNKKYVTRIIPSGFLYKDKKLVIGQGVLLDLEVLLQEIEQFKEFDILNRLLISDKCHLLFPYHKLVDAKVEEKTGGKIGSTKNGVAYCMQDKVGRRGIRVCDLRTFITKFSHKGTESLFSKMNDNMDYWRITESEKRECKIKCQNLIDEFYFLCQKCIIDSSTYLNESLSRNKNILAEGAQANFLDIEAGTYPFVTSTCCTVAGVCSGLGIAPKNINKVIGLTKAYTTRVGNGPFSTELFDEIGEKIAKTGNEFGAVTNRKRRCGWLNLDELKSAAITNGFDELIITKVDVLYGIDPIKVYADGRYIEMKGCNNYKDDENFGNFIRFVEKFIEIPITYISYGPDREEMVRNE